MRAHFNGDSGYEVGSSDPDCCYQSSSLGLLGAEAPVMMRNGIDLFFSFPFLRQLSAKVRPKAQMLQRSACTVKGVPSIAVGASGAQTHLHLLPTLHK